MVGSVDHTASCSTNGERPIFSRPASLALPHEAAMGCAHLTRRNDRWRRMVTQAHNGATGGNRTQPYLLGRQKPPPGDCDRKWCAPSVTIRDLVGFSHACRPSTPEAHDWLRVQESNLCLWLMRPSWNHLQSTLHQKLVGPPGIEPRSSRYERPTLATELQALRIGTDKGIRTPIATLAT